MTAPTTRERATYEIRRLIAERGLQPGDRLPSERELVRTIGASRASIRGAIGHLSAAGVVQSRPHSGTFVSRAEHGAALEGLRIWLREHNLSLEELVQFRQAVEPAAASTAAGRRTTADLDAMREQVLLMRRATADNDYAAYSRADRHFHGLVARASGNRLFSLVLQSMGEALDRYLAATAMLGPAMLARSLEDHQAILGAIEAGDPDAASAAATHHTYQTVMDFRIVGSGDP